MKKLALLLLSLCVLLGAQTGPTNLLPCSPFTTCNCLSRMNGQPVTCPPIPPPSTSNPTYPALVEQPFYAELTSPDGELEDVNLCPPVACQVTNKTDAQALLALLQPLVSAPTGLYPGATLTLIQGFGNDQNPTQQTGVFTYVPANPQDKRRIWYIYTTTGQVVVGSPVEWMIETEDAQGVGRPGAWQWKAPYPQLAATYPNWKTFVWVPSN